MNDAMTSLIQKIAKLANLTFSNLGKDKSFSDNLAKLKLLTNQLKKDDVCVTADYLGGSTSQLKVWNSRESQDAPVTYIEIYENEVFSLGIFILKNGARIPLHDHPEMHGLIKVIHGTVSVQSYSAVDVEEVGDLSAFGVVLAKKLPQAVVDDTREPCCLTPLTGNYHEIKTVGGPAAFVDILSPPYDYDADRECGFYRETLPRSIPRSFLPSGLSKVLATSRTAYDVVLVKCGQPADYWCDGEVYSGPKIRL